MRGAIFESWVVSEILKARVHVAEQPDLYLYNAQGRTEVDIVVDTGSRVVAVETKPGQTVVPEFFKGLDRLAASLGGAVPLERVLVHGGAPSHVQRGTRVVPWNAVFAQDWGLRRRRRSSS